MELHNNTNISLFLDGNATAAEKTMYETCRHMPELMFFYLSMQTINMFLGIPANLLVLCLISCSRSDSSTSDIFIWHLAVLDTFFCLILPLEMTNLMFLASGKFWYVLRFFYAVKDSSVLFLACICMDRYMAVRHPIVFSNLKDRSHRPVCAGVMWLITLAYAVVKCLGVWPNFTVFSSVILAMFAFLLYCNASIMLALRKSGPGRDDLHPVKKRAFKMVLIILAIIVFNYLPPVALLPFHPYFSADMFNCYINYFVFGFMDVSSSIQPVLYLSNKMPQCPTWCCGRRDTKDKEAGKAAESSTVVTATA